MLEVQDPSVNVTIACFIISPSEYASFGKPLRWCHSYFFRFVTCLERIRLRLTCWLQKYQIPFTYFSSV